MPERKSQASWFQFHSIPFTLLPLRNSIWDKQVQPNWRFQSITLGRLLSGRVKWMGIEYRWIGAVIHRSQEQLWHESLGGHQSWKSNRASTDQRQRRKNHQVCPQTSVVHLCRWGLSRECLCRWVLSLKVVPKKHLEGAKFHSFKKVLFELGDPYANRLALFI